METSKRIILVGALLCSLFAYTQSRDAHLGRAVDYINRGDYVRADQEIGMVRYWGCEEEHAFEVRSMERACGYIQHCTQTNTPQAARDSMAIYLIEACGNQVNILSAADNKREAERVCRLGLQMCELSIGQTHQDYAVLCTACSSMACSKESSVDIALICPTASAPTIQRNHRLSIYPQICGANLLLFFEICKILG